MSIRLKNMYINSRPILQVRCVSCYVKTAKVITSEDRDNESFSSEDDDDVITEGCITPDKQSSNEYDCGLFIFLFENADELYDWLRLFTQENLGGKNTKRFQDESVATIVFFHNTNVLFQLNLQKKHINVSVNNKITLYLISKSNKFCN